MRPGFQQVSIPFLTGDGRNGSLLDYLNYTDSLGRAWRTKTSTDGLSTPRIIWFLIPPFGKRTWFSGVLHDGGFRNRLEIYRNGRWEKITLNEQECNWLIWDALGSQRANRWERAVIWLALNWLGWRAFDEDRHALARKYPSRILLPSARTPRQRATMKRQAGQ